MSHRASSNSCIFWLVAAVLTAAGPSCTGPNPAYRKPEVSDSDGATIPPRDTGPDRTVPRADLAPPDTDIVPDSPTEEPVDAGTGTETSDKGPDNAADGPGPDANAPDTAPDAAPPPPPAWLTEGLNVHFAFDEPPGTGGNRTQTDALGNRLTTTDLAWRTDAPPGAPEGAKALAFNGDGYANITTAKVLRNDLPKTIALWFRSEAGTPRIRTLVTLAQMSAETTNVGIQVGFDNDLLAAWRYGQQPEMTAPATRNTWTHVAYTYSGNTGGAVHRLYVNGQLRTTLSNRPMTGTDRFLNRTMLGTYDPPDEMFVGLMRQLRIYDRLLDADQIAALSTYK